MVFHLQQTHPFSIYTPTAVYKPKSRLEAILRRSIVPSNKSATTNTNDVIEDLQKISSINNEHIKRVLYHHNVILRNHRSIKEVSDELRREKAAHAKAKVPEVQQIEPKKKIFTHSVPFIDRLRTMNKVNPDDTYPDDDLTGTLRKIVEEAVPSDSPSRKARIVHILNWLQRDYVPLIDKLQNRDDLRFGDVALPLLLAVNKLNPKPVFDINRFGHIGTQIKQHHLNAINKAILEEITMPNGVFFDLQNNNPLIAYTPYMGVCLKDIEFAYTPRGRQIPLIKAATVQGSHTGQVIEGSYIVETVEYRTIKQHALETMRNRFVSNLARSNDEEYSFDAEAQNDLLVSLASSDFIYSTQNVLGRRYNPECHVDLITHAKANTSPSSSMLSKLRKTSTISEAKSLARTLNGVRAMLVAIGRSDNPTQIFLEAIIPVVYPSFASVTVKEEPEESTYRQKLDNLAREIIELKDSKITYDKVLNDLRSIRRLGRKIVRSLLERNNVKLKEEKGEDKEKYLPILLKALRDEKAMKPNTNVPVSLLKVNSGHKLAELVGPHLDSSLTSHDGRIQREAWDAYFHRLFSYSDKPIDDIITELNHLLKIAAKKICQVHFPQIHFSVDKSNAAQEYNPDWKYFQPHLAAVS